MKRTWTYLGAGLLAAIACLPAAAQDADIKKELEELKKGQQAILQQLKAMEGRMQAKPAAPKGPNVKGVVFEIGDNPVVGLASAKLTLIELTDYQ